MTKRKCLTCGGLYQYCSTCYKDRFKPAWYRVFCSQECKSINEIVSANTVGELSDLEAKHKLKELNLFGKEIQKKSMEDILNRILSIEEPEEIKQDNNEENTETTITDENEIEISDVETETVSDENKELSNTSKSVKKKYSKNKKTNNNE